MRGVFPQAQVQAQAKKTAALISQSRRVMGRDNALLYDGFFLLPSCGSSLVLNGGACANAGLNLFAGLRMFVKFFLTVANRINVIVPFTLSKLKAKNIHFTLMYYGKEDDKRGKGLFNSSF
ncbi:MAG: hypothetical protein HFH93_11865 [Lachnospiraceae bacterium]|nr:hypothetical protein [Lachnospiraceae bacterium]